MRYSVFADVHDVYPKLVDEPWPVFLSRMSAPIATANKKSIGLFNGTVFDKGTCRRVRSCSSTVSMFILDFDNKKPKPDNAPEGYVDEMVDVPATVSLVESILGAYEYVLATSHSHTDAWPRFRVVLPLSVEVPSATWGAIARSIVPLLHLSTWEHTFGPEFTNPVQMYFWPSHPLGGHCYVKYNQGHVLQPPTVDPLAVSSSKAGFGNGAALPGSKFTPAQVQRFIEAELGPEKLGEDFAAEEANDTHVKCPCPLHQGRNSKFYMNILTGMWDCKSKCLPPNKAGDLYSYYQLKYKVTFPEAKKRVHEIIGGEPGAHFTPGELAARIQTSSVDDLDDIVLDLASQTTIERNKLFKQLITTHQLPPEVAKAKQAELQAARKIVSIDRRDDTKTLAAMADAVDHQSSAEAMSREFNLVIDPQRYLLDNSGVHIMRMDPATRRYARAEPPLADRPIWPRAMGNDLATDKVWVQLAWHGSKGVLHTEWHPTTLLNNRDSLLSLNDAPVSLQNVNQISGFLAYAKTTISEDFMPITSAVGWVGSETSLRFVLPDDEKFAYIGPKLQTAGDLTGWVKGLMVLLGMGLDGYRGLAALGLSIAAPFVRLAHKRNPIVCFVSESSKGKSIVVQYALSVWGAPDRMTIPASSSTKGMQDIGKDRPDFPLFVDELQQLYKKSMESVEDTVYYFGNGQRRINSSKEQVAKGGERRFGVTFMAAENEVMGALQRGAQNRVVEIHGAPLLAQWQADVIHSAGHYNYGVLGKFIADTLNECWVNHHAAILEAAKDFGRDYPELRGDDPYTMAFVQQGLRILQEVLGVDIPSTAVTTWLIHHLLGHRRSAKDTAEATFMHVMSAVLSMPWGTGGSGKNELVDGKDYIAWRREATTDPELTPVEINPSADKVQSLLKALGQNDKIAGVWGERGWLRKQNKNLRWYRSSKATSGPGALVWRITVAGLAVAGLNADFEPIEGSI